MAKTKKTKSAGKRTAKQADEGFPIMHSRCVVSTDPPGNGTGAVYLIELHYQRNEDIVFVDIPLDTAQEFIAAATLLQTGRAVYYPANKEIAVERWNLATITPIVASSRKH